MKISGSACISKMVYFALQNIIGKDTDLFIANSVFAFQQKLKNKTYDKYITQTSKQFKIGDTKYKLRIDAVVVLPHKAYNMPANALPDEPVLHHIKLSIMGLNGTEYIDMKKFFSEQENVIFEETCLAPHQDNGENI